jgi:hypothetical protein
MIRLSSILSLIVLTTVAACGGGVDLGHDSPPPANDAGSDAIAMEPPAYGGSAPGYGDPYGPGYGYGSSPGYGYDPGYGYGYPGYGYGYPAPGYGYGYAYPPECGYGYGPYGYGPYGYGYGWGCQVPDTTPQHHMYPIPASGPLVVSFFWNASAGPAAPVDLTVVADGNGTPLFQVFSSGFQAYARVGLQVIPIQPGVSYTVVMLQSGDVVTADLQLGGQILLTASEQASSADPFGDFITPGFYYRQNVSLY